MHKFFIAGMFVLLFCPRVLVCSEKKESTTSDTNFLGYFFKEWNSISRENYRETVRAFKKVYPKKTKPNLKNVYIEGIKLEGLLNFEEKECGSGEIQEIITLQPTSLIVTSVSEVFEGERKPADKDSGFGFGIRPDYFFEE